MLPPAASPTCPGPTPPAASPARPRATRRLSCSRSGPGRRATSSPLTGANPPSPGRLLHSGWLMMCDGSSVHGYAVMQMQCLSLSLFFK
ncbi:hypothetical protein U9M48_013622 [Paspalum notatum var. saurae]|uniref:Uncharacterized protein n=1 Tax=Paspalum notatum var. saurae TaxID=547442 RepID=A0AAQ3WJR5_PASNO